MGTTRTDYVMLAVKLPFDAIDPELDILYEYNDNGYEQKVTKHNGLTSVSDGMNGEYIFIGRVIAKVIESSGEGLPIVDCLDYSPEEAEQIRYRMKDLFGIDAPPASVYAFSHWH